jgi:hypothetical protein
MSLTSTGVFSRPLEAVKARLLGHIGKDKILEDFKLEDAALTPTEGKKDLPKIYITIPGFTMASHPGKDLMEAGMEVRVVVAADKDLGLVNFAETFEKVADALVIDPTTGKLDPGLNGTLARPLEIDARENFATPNGLTYNAQIPISFRTKVFPRGECRTKFA